MLTIQLQSVGTVPAIEGSEVRVGDTTIWNYGYKYEVISIQPKGSVSLLITERSADGKEYARTVRKSRPVAVIRNNAWAGVA